MTILDSTPEIPTKTCTKCKRELPATLDYFYATKKGKYGLFSKCQACCHDYYLNHREESRDRKRAYNKKYHAEHRDKEREYRSAYNQTHRDERRSYTAIYNARHKQERQVYRDQHKEQKRAYDAQHLDERRIRQQRRRQSHKDETYSSAELQAVLIAHTDKKGILRCALCGKPIKGKYHIDHWIPLSKGGMNNAGNLRIMHPKCNQSKNAKLPHKIGRLL